MDIAPIILITILLALVFDFINGMNDAANSIATIVATKVLSPGLAVLWAAFFNFAAVWIFETHVATTMSRGVIDPSIVDGDNYFILCSLLGAIIWGRTCSYLGIPISLSHTLLGGLIGPALVKAGSTDVLVWSSLREILLFIIITPLIGMVLSFIIQNIVFWIFRRSKPQKTDNLFRLMQLGSSAMFGLGHGGNDAQKTAGVIILLLVTNGQLDHSVIEGTTAPPIWIFYLCYIVIGLGTLMGGWKVVKTMGHKLTALKPMGGFCAETAGAITLYSTAALGIPCSTTQTITGAIMGVGATKRVSAVNWQVVYKLVATWIITIPSTIIMSGLFYWIVSRIVN